MLQNSHKVSVNQILKDLIINPHLGEKFTLIWWVILILRKRLQTSMHWWYRSFF